MPKAWSGAPSGGPDRSIPKNNGAGPSEAEPRGTPRIRNFRSRSSFGSMTRDARHRGDASEICFSCDEMINSIGLGCKSGSWPVPSRNGKELWSGVTTVTGGPWTIDLISVRLQASEPSRLCSQAGSGLGHMPPLGYVKKKIRRVMMNR